MKKLFCFLLALSIVPTSIHAQKDAGGGVQWGIKLGPNFSSWSGDDAEPTGSEDKKMKIGLHGGVFVMIPISSMFYFQPELLYSMEGVKYEDAEDKASITANYLNLPLSLRLQTTSGFYVVFGPQIGFSLGGKTKFEFMGTEDEQDLEDLRGMILSGLIGAGFKSTSGFGVYARYAHGFSNVFDFESGDDPDVKGSTISLSLFYMLGGKK
jgi:outer membrane protein with beta-barrel domain